MVLEKFTEKTFCRAIRSRDFEMLEVVFIYHRDSVTVMRKSNRVFSSGWLAVCQVYCYKTLQVEIKDGKQ